MSVKGRLNILFLSRWYPNRIDAMEGLFVQKHAQAVAMYERVHVLFAREDESVMHTEVFTSCDGFCAETIVYYPRSRNRIVRAVRYYAAMLKGYRHIRCSGFTPDVVHANVLARVVAVAYLLRLLKGTPYVVSEHWSRYMTGDFKAVNTLRRWATRILARRAACVMPVSECLQKAMTACGVRNSCMQVVHNTVDAAFALPHSYQAHEKVRLLHISCFDERSKNIKAILRAVAQLSCRRSDFEMVLVGSGVDFEEVRTYADGLTEWRMPVVFVGEQTPNEVVEWFYASDVFVLFSNYETSGVVLMESLSCGIPIVSTPCGIAPEVINESNGILVPVADEVALCDALDRMITQCKGYDKELIRSASQQFFPHIIGKQLSNVYRSVL